MADTETDGDEFVSRPRDHLLNYPVEMRWEFTRRHPYYLGLWEEVRRYHDRPPGSAGGPDDARGLAAKIGLGAIGVGGVPVPPETPFDDISGDDPSFLCGSLQPLTVRAIATILLGQLGPESQQFLGQALFLNASHVQDATLTDEKRKANLTALLGLVQLSTLPDLDKVPSSPIFFMHLGASQETIKEDANRQARLWKAKAGLASPKVHTAKLADYLAVWDRIEGWTGAGYDTGREQTLDRVAAATKKSRSTLHDHYKAAFRAVVGRDFTPTLWWRTMGRMKLAQLSCEPEGAILWLARRRFARHQDRLVTATTLAAALPPEFTGSPVGNAASVDDIDLLDTVTAIEEMIGRGDTDDQIAAALDLVDPLSRKLLRYVRQKRVDLKAVFG